jgi:hypothetical protein
MRSANPPLISTVFSPSLLRCRVSGAKQLDINTGVVRKLVNSREKVALIDKMPGRMGYIQVTSLAESVAELYQIVKQKAPDALGGFLLYVTYQSEPTLTTTAPFMRLKHRSSAPSLPSEPLHRLEERLRVAFYGASRGDNVRRYWGSADGESGCGVYQATEGRLGTLGGLPPHYPWGHGREGIGEYAPGRTALCQALGGLCLRQEASSRGVSK